MSLQLINGKKREEAILETAGRSQCCGVTALNLTCDS